MNINGKDQISNNTAQKSWLQQWLEQLGIIKKLQVTLTLSWILILLLAMQIMKLNNINKNKDIAIVSSKLDLNETKIFAQKYLKVFFGAGSDKELEYLKIHSDEELFIKSIYPELTARRKEKIESEFIIDQLYVEAISNTSTKAVCFGQEKFPEGTYQPRELSIELLIDQSQPEAKVSSIPVFRALK